MHFDEMVMQHLRKIQKIFLLLLRWVLYLPAVSVLNYNYTVFLATAANVYDTSSGLSLLLIEMYFKDHSSVNDSQYPSVGTSKCSTTGGKILLITNKK